MFHESPIAGLMREEARPLLGLRFLVGAAAVVVIVGGMRAAEPILVPFFLAAFLSILASPAVFWLKGRGFPYILGVALIVMAMLAVGLGIGALVGTSINDFTRAVPSYQQRLYQEIWGWVVWLESHGIPASKFNDQFLELMDPAAAMSLAGQLLTNVGSVVTDAVLILLTVIFMLLEASGMPTKLRAAIGNPSADLSTFRQFTSMVERYLVIKTIVSLCVGVLIGLWVALLGIDYPVLWGLVAFLLNYIPNIGSIIAAIPAILLAIVQHGLPVAFVATLGYVGINLVTGNLLEPRLLGRSLGLSTLIVFLSLVFWGWVFGTMGMLLSVPLTMTVKIALEHNPKTRWIAILLGPEVAAHDEVEHLEAGEAEDEPAPAHETPPLAEDAPQKA